MSNMAYCRFSNTLSDLRDCQSNMGEDGYISDEEMKARKDLVRLCQNIADDFFEDVVEYGE